MPKKKHSNGFVKAAVTGAALVGAGALLAAAALSDEDTKKMFDKKAREAGDKLEVLMKELKVKGGKAYEDASEQFEVLKVKLQKIVEEGKKSDEYKRVLEEISKITEKLDNSRSDTGKDLEGLVEDVKTAVEDLKEEFDKYEEANK